MTYVMRILEFGFIKMGAFIALLLLVPLTGSVPFKTGRQKIRNYKPDLNYQLPTFYLKTASPSRNSPMSKFIPRRYINVIWHRKKPFHIRSQNNQRLSLNSQIPYFKRINDDFSFNKVLRGRHYLQNDLINYYNPRQSKNQITPLRFRSNILKSISKNMKHNARITLNNYKQNTYVNVKKTFRNQRYKKELFGFNDGRFVNSQPRGIKRLRQNRGKVKTTWMNENPPKIIKTKKKIGDRNVTPKERIGGWPSAKRNKKFYYRNKHTRRTKKRIFRKNHRITRDVNMEEKAKARQTFYNLDGNRKRSLAGTGICDFAGRQINIGIQDLLLPCDDFLQQKQINDLKKKKLSFPYYQINCQDNSFVYPKESYGNTAVDYNNRYTGDTDSAIGFNSDTDRYENRQDRYPKHLSFRFENNDKGNLYALQGKAAGVPDSETKYNGNRILPTNFAMNEKVKGPQIVKINNNEMIGCDQQTDLKSPALNKRYRFWKNEDVEENGKGNANNYEEGSDKLDSEFTTNFQTLAENKVDLESLSDNYDKNDNDNTKITRSMPTRDENKKGLDYEKEDFQKSKSKLDRKDKDKSIRDYVQPKAEDSFISEPSNEDGLSEETDEKQHQNHKKTEVAREEASKDIKKKFSKHSHTHYNKYEDVHREKEGVYISSDNQFTESDSLDLNEIPVAELFESYRQSRGIKESSNPENEESKKTSGSYKPPIAGSYMNNFLSQSINQPNHNPVNQAERENTNPFKNKSNNLTEVNDRVRSSSLENGVTVPTAEDSSNLHKTHHNFQSHTYLSGGKKQSNIKLDRMSVPQEEFNNINIKNINKRRVIRRNIEKVIKDYNKNKTHVVTAAVFTHDRPRSYSDRNGFTDDPSKNNRESGSSIPDKNHLGNKMGNSNEKNPFNYEKFLMDEKVFTNTNVSPEPINNYNGDIMRSANGQTSVTPQRDENNRQDIGTIVSNSQTTGEIKETVTTRFKSNIKRSTDVQEKTKEAVYEDIYPKRTNKRSDKKNREVSMNYYNADSDNDLLRDVTSSGDDDDKSSTESHAFNERLNVVKRRLSNDFKPIGYSEDTTDGNDINRNFTVFSEVPISEDNQLVRHRTLSSNKDKLNYSRESYFDSKIQNLKQEKHLQETESVPNSSVPLLFLSKINKNKRNSIKFSDDKGNKEDHDKAVSRVPLHPNSLNNNESITNRIPSNVSLDHNLNDNNKREENNVSAANSSIYTKISDRKLPSWLLEIVKNFTTDEDVSIGPIKINESDSSDFSRDNTSEARQKRFYRDSRKLSTNNKNCTDESKGCVTTNSTLPLGIYSSAQKMKQKSEAAKNTIKNKIIKKNVKMEKLSKEECVSEECFSSLNMRFHTYWTKIFCGGWIEIIDVFGNGKLEQLPGKSGKYSKGNFVFNIKVVRRNSSYEMNTKDCNFPCSGLPEKLVIKGNKLTRQAVNKPWSDVINYISGDSVDIWEPFKIEVLSPGSYCQTRNTSFKILLDGTDDNLSVMNMVFVEPEKNGSPVKYKLKETGSQTTEKKGKEKEQISDHKFKVTSKLKITLDKINPGNTMNVAFNSILQRTKKTIPSKEPGLYSYASGRRCPGIIPLTNYTGIYTSYNPYNHDYTDLLNNTFPELNAKLHYLKMSGNFQCSLGSNCEDGAETENLECTFLDIDMKNSDNAKEHFINFS